MFSVSGVSVFSGVFGISGVSGSSDMLWNCTLPIQFVAEPCQCQNDSQAGTAVPAQCAFQLAFLQLIIFTLLACVASFIFKSLQLSPCVSGVV